MRKEITFDRFIRGLLIAAALFVGYVLLWELSSVLIPFFIAWAVAYMLNPLVKFLQLTCRLRYRALAVFLAVMLFFTCIGGLFFLAIPRVVSETVHLKDAAITYIQKGAENTTIPRPVQDFIREHANELQVESMLRQDDVKEVIRKAVPKVWDFATSTAGTLLSLAASLIAVLYLFLLLIDWERYAKGWIHYIPHKHRPFAQQLASDIEESMAGYFKGQAIIALVNCVMFCIGFLLIDFPLPYVLGILIGLLSFVPYIQIVGFVPAIILALLRAAETGENFWFLMGGVVLVYIVAQIVQDLLVTPKVMGSIMGLRPAVVLLSLSIFGYLLGIVGLIIALPVTTLAQAYYKRYVIEEKDSSTT